MGPDFQNALPISFLAWAVGLLIMVINLSAIYDFALQHLPSVVGVYIVFALLVLAYLVFIFYLALGPDR